MLLVVLGACDGPSAQRCHLGHEQELWRSGSRRLSSIALAVSSSGPKSVLAAWSDEDGVRALALSADGELRGRPERVFDRATSSLDLMAAPEGYRLAALAPGDLFQGGGGVHVLALDPAGRALSSTRVGPAGAYSKRVSIAAGAVVWHDGGPGTFMVRARADSGEAIEIARGRMGALSPAIARAPDGSYGIAWSELQPRKDGGIQVPVVFRRFGPRLSPLGAAEIVAHASIEGTDPALLFRDGGFTIAYRDVQGEDRRAGFYVARIGKRGATRVSRANGPSGPDIAYCHDLYVGATVRTYRHELLLGFNRFDALGQKRGGELQIFSDRVHFSSVEVECLAVGYALLYGEEDQRGARLLYNRVLCDP